MGEQPEKAEQDKNKLLSEQSVQLDSMTTNFIADSKAGVESESGGFAAITLYILLALIIISIIWAYFAEVEEVTRGEGKVVSSTHLQVIQNLEGGIVKKILVREGQHVKKGDLLVELDDTRFLTQHNERLAKKAALQGEVVRLTAEAKGADSIEFSEEFKKHHPAEVAQATELFEANKLALDANLDNLRKSYALAKREYDIILPLTRQGVMSEVDKVRLERQLNGIQGEILEKKDKARTDAQAQLNKVRAELSVLNEQILGSQDRVDRALVRAPVDGIINQIFVNTVGAVLQPGEKIVEIVPLDEKLTVQVYIRPADIGFIHPEQVALIKVSAFDFSVYGGIDAKVSKISADSIVDDAGNSYYEVDLKTDQNFVEDRKRNRKLAIIPGMTVTASIVTGKKSILDYIMKPFIKAKYTALRER